jgi:hypothetical protein
MTELDRVKTPRSFHTPVVLVCFRGLRSIRSEKIAKNLRLRDRSHFFHEFLHGLDPELTSNGGARISEASTDRKRVPSARLLGPCLFGIARKPAKS